MTPEEFKLAAEMVEALNRIATVLEWYMKIEAQRG
jgi:hypothetical protein